MQTANIFISDPSLRAAFIREHEKTGYSLLNKFGVAAAQAAYQHGQAWRDELIAYLEGNASFLRKTLKGTGGAIRLIEPKGTYLMWLDCRNLSMTDAQLQRFFTEKAKVMLHKGSTFGKSGSGFMRMNIACPKTTLERAADNITAAVKEVLHA